MVPSDAPEMPKRILITSTDKVKITLYIERDDIICTFCLTPGHVVEKCKKRLNHEQLFPTINEPVAHRLFVHKTGRPQNNSSPSTSNSSSIWQQPSISQEQNTFMPQFSSPTTSTEDKDQTESTSQPQTIFGEILSKSSHQQTSRSLSTPEVPLDNSLSLSPLQTQLPISGPDDFEEDSANKPSQNPSKRIHSPDEDVMSESSSTSTASLTTGKKKRKAKEKSKSALEAVIDAMKFTDSFLPADQFRKFMSECRGRANGKAVADSYTSNTGALLVQLQQAENLCVDINLKRRFKRAQDALFEDDTQEEET